jgi:hypothetical protein
MAPLVVRANKRELNIIIFVRIYIFFLSLSWWKGRIEKSMGASQGGVL